MATNIEIESRIRQRTRDYTAAAQHDIAALLTENARLRVALGEEYDRRIKADEVATDLLVEKTKLGAKILELGRIVRTQSAEIAEQHEAIKTLRGLEVVE